MLPTRGGPSDRTPVVQIYTTVNNDQNEQNGRFSLTGVGYRTGLVRIIINNVSPSWSDTVRAPGTVVGDRFVTVYPKGDRRPEHHGRLHIGYVTVTP